MKEIPPDDVRNVCNLNQKSEPYEIREIPAVVYQLPPEEYYALVPKSKLDAIGELRTRNGFYAHFGGVLFGLAATIFSFPSARNSSIWSGIAAAAVIIYVVMIFLWICNYRKAGRIKEGLKADNIQIR
jgi:hypothetical protein